MNKFEAIEILEEVKILDDSMYQYNITYLNALDMAIKSLKTEAIPVEWIQKWMVDNDTGWGEMSYISPVKTMLEEWAGKKEE